MPTTNTEQEEQQPKEIVRTDTDDDCLSQRSQTLDGDREKQDPEKPEDDPRGWIIVVAGFLMITSCYGIITSWCVMQDFYERTMFEDVQNAQLQLSFVGTICLVFVHGMGPFAQILRSIVGATMVYILGAALMTIGLICAGFSTKIWHLYLTQGVTFGLGVSLIFVLTLSVAPQYFPRRRGLALGIITSGSGLGAVIMPYVMTPLNNSLGAGWTFRILGFISLASNIMACIYIKDKNPRPAKRARLSDIIKIEVLKNKTFRIWCLSATIQLAGYYTPFFFIPSYATWVGLSDSQGASLIAASSAFNFAGRIFTGILADRVGPVNVQTVSLLISGLSTLIIWTLAYDYGTLMAYVIILGFSCGSYFALLSSTAAEILGMDRLPAGLSWVLLFNVVSVMGPNIASGIDQGTNAEPYFAYKMFSGVAYIVGMITLIWVKFSMNRKIFAKV
ncbi:major facilitator superfamily domain-containing protein [Fennellomyces sp. T-0311]|nr:major facilitator superfamily domain-containing protein [Fennellomyces sp. T-0311]